MLTTRPTAPLGLPRLPRVSALLLTVVILLLLDLSGGAAEPVKRPAIALDPAQPYRIWADKIVYDPLERAYLAEGNVTIRKEDYSLSAQWIRFDTAASTAMAKGEVVLTTNGDRLTGDRVAVDLESDTGTLYDGSLFLAENHFYIRGEEIRKTGPDTYIAQNATITTCDGPSPDWAISGRRVAVTIEGYGTATHASMEVRGIPVLYSPYVAFPVKLKRQSGLLAPQLGYSDRKGWQYRQPLFLVLGESADATLTADYMSARGLKGGVELRYFLSEISRGALMADGLLDRRVDDGQGDNSRNWGYDDTSNSDASRDILRPNRDRYWLRMKHDHALPAGFMAKLDLDLVSDQDYLPEFKRGYTGFNDTRDYFLDTFGRDIDDDDDTVRPNRLNLARTWGSYSLNVEGRWDDNVVARRQGTDDRTLQRLPALDLDISRHRLSDSPLYLTAASEAAHLFEADGDKGYRLDLYPRLAWPFKWDRFLSLEPSAGYRQTLWNLYEVEEDPDREGQARHRELYDLGLDLSSEIYRIFPGILPGTDRGKHNLRPQLIYTYIPRVDQEDLPDFDSSDRVDRENQLTWVLTQTLTSRYPQPAAPSDAGLPRYAYRQVARLKLDQDYDINAANDGDPEPWSDLRLDLELTPVQRLALTSEARWSVYDQLFTRYSIGGSLSDRRGDRVAVEYRQVLADREANVSPSETLNSRALLRLRDGLDLRGTLEWDLFNDEVLEWLVGVTYTRQCWSLDLSHSVEDEDRRTYVTINLVGLGKIGG
ncbi:MAG: LPS assembly protein LptD [Desulfosarcinaceae bacterium]|nr:LPS assembly protein LptD [Desulfosarcinaceae bacterium]